MGFLVARLSANARDRMYTVVRVLGGVCMCLTGGLLASVMNSKIRHASLLHELIISLFDDIYISLIILGVLMLLIAALGWKINRNIVLQPINHSVGRCHICWCVFLVLSVVSMALAISSMSNVLESLKTEVEPRYRYGSSLYLENQNWQLAVDRIQASLECCGASGHTDWYSHSWIPLKLLPADRSLYFKIIQPDGQVLVPLTPSSCCRSISPACGHKAWLEAKDHTWDDIKPVDPQMLYTAGCVDAIINLIGWDLRCFKYFLLTIASLQGTTLVCSRYLYTSTLNSWLLGRPRGKAVGWLVGPIVRTEAHKTLDDFDKGCGDEDTVVEVKEKKKFKCMSKIRKRCRKPSDSDETQASEVRRPLLKSPCLTRLKQKCKKKKNLEMVTNSESEAETEKKTLLHNIDENQPEPEIQSKPIDAIHSEAENVKQSQNAIESNNQPMVKKKLSKNLIDVEYETVSERKIDHVLTAPPEVPVLETAAPPIVPGLEIVAPPKLPVLQIDVPHKLPVLKMVAEHKTPFIIDGPKVKLISESLLNSSFNKKALSKTEHSSMFEGSESEFENGRGVQETLKIFENPAKGDLRGDRQMKKLPEYQINLIDFSDSTSTRQRERGGVTSPPDTSRSEGEYPPVVLRNYGPPPKF